MPGSPHLEAHTFQDQLRVGRKPGFSTLTFRIHFLIKSTINLHSELDSENHKKKPSLPLLHSQHSPVNNISNLSDISNN